MLTSRLLWTALIATNTLVSSQTDGAIESETAVPFLIKFPEGQETPNPGGVDEPKHYYRNFVGGAETPVPGAETDFPIRFYKENLGGETPVPLEVFYTLGGGQCPLRLACCEEDCCGEGTSWDGASCILNPNSSGFDGTYSIEYKVGCILRSCCENECCSAGTEYDSSTALCVVLQGTPTGRLAYRDPETCPKPASGNNCTDVTDQVKCDGCDYSNQCLATAANSTFTSDTCLNATQLQLV